MATEIDNLLNVRTGLSVVEGIGNFIPGPLGHGLGAIANVAGSVEDANEEETTLAQALGVRNLKALAGQSAAVKRLLSEMDDAPTSNLARYGVAAGGSIAGAAVGAILLPFGGFLIGGLAGGMVADQGYKIFQGPEGYKPVSVAAGIKQMQKQGQAVDKKHVFLALAGSLPKSDRKRISNAVAEAGDSDRKLARVTERFKYLTEAKAMAILGDQYNPAEDALVQLTDKISTADTKTGKKLNPIVLLLDIAPQASSPVAASENYAATLQAQGVSQEEALKIAGRMSEMGVAADENGQGQLPPSKGGSLSVA